MKINIYEIINIATAILLKLKEIKGSQLKFNNDFYWKILFYELYNPYIQPIITDLGQLSDDLNVIHDNFKSDNLIFYGLERVAEILKALSIENSKLFAMFRRTSRTIDNEGL